MRSFLLLPLALAFAAPASAQLPISGVGNVNGGAPYGGFLRTFGYTDTPHAPRWRESRVNARDVELAGQIGQLRRRVRQMRDNGEITRDEARRMRREIRHIGGLYYGSGPDGLSDAAAAMVQARISAFASQTAAPRVPTGR